MNDRLGRDMAERASQSIGVAQIDVSVAIGQRDARMMTSQLAADEAFAAGHQQSHPETAIVRHGSA